MGKFLPASDKLVILLHGAFNNAASMDHIADFFNRRGIATLNISYPSIKGTLKELSEHTWRVIEDNSDLVESASQLHIVGHSMGNIVARYMLDRHDHEIGRPGSVVMLAPPNHGSELIDRMHKMNFCYAGLLGAYFNFLGPAISALTTDREHPMIPGHRPVHVISGNSGYDLNFPYLAALLADPVKTLAGNFHTAEHDGVLTVESTKIAGMQSHTVFPYAHTTIHRQKDVLDLIARNIGLPAENKDFLQAAPHADAA